MKKILAILLACAMVFAMAACANTENPDNTAPDASMPSQSGDNSTTNTEPTPGGNDATEPSEGWQTKDVELPTFDTVEVMKLTACEGKLTASVVKSPWQFEDFDKDAAMNALKTSPLFKDWVFGTEEKEYGALTNYEEIGQVFGYEWEQSIVATREVYDTMAYASDLTLTFTGDTQYVHGYEQIKLEIDIPAEEVTSEIQDEVYKLLQVIFGEYAEALCYAPVVEGENLLLEVKQDNAIIYLRRGISKYGLTFNMYMNPIMSGNAYREFPGDGSYVSIAKQPEYIYEVLNEKIGSVDLSDYKNICAEMLRQYFPEYSRTTPDSDAYRIRTLKLDNGHVVEEFEIEANIGTEELSGTAAPDLIIEYEVVHNGTSITDVELKMECGVGQVHADADLEKTRDEFFATGVKMFKCILKDDIDAAEVIVKGEDGKHQSYNYKTNVLGLEKDASISFTIGETFLGTLVGYIYFNIS